MADNLDAAPSRAGAAKSLIAMDRFAIGRFVGDWQRLLREVYG